MLLRFIPADSTQSHEVEETKRNDHGISVLGSSVVPATPILLGRRECANLRVFCVALPQNTSDSCAELRWRAGMA